MNHYTQAPQRVFTRGRVVGELLEGGRVLLCKRNHGKPMLNRMNERAWCISAQVIEELAEAGTVETIIMADPWHKVSWTISFEDFLTRGSASPVQFGKNELQYRVWERYWEQNVLA